MSSLASADAAARNGNLPLLNLQLGWPTPRLCAREQLLKASQDVLADGENMAPILLYGPHKGYPSLCESIAQWLSGLYSPAQPLHATRICITNGASASLANIALKFTDPTYTRRIFMIEPTYFLACPIFEDCGFHGRLRGIPETIDDGIDLKALEDELLIAEDEHSWPEAPLTKIGPNYPHVYRYVLYCTTTFSNPSAKTMPTHVRETLVKIARKYDVLIISDDVYDFLSWTGEQRQNVSSPVVPPRLVDVDHDMPACNDYGNAISNGSFAKVIGPGIRVGWVEGPPAFVSSLGLVGSSSSGGAPSHFASTLVDKMLRIGALQRLISDVLIPEYQRRYMVMMESVEKHLAPLGFAVEATRTPDNTAGGYFTYLRIPDVFTQHRVFAKTLAGVALRDYSLRISFGHMFVVAGDQKSIARAEDPEGFAYCIRLSWSWLEADQIEQAIERLASCTMQLVGRMEDGEDVSKGVHIGIR